MAVTTKAWEQVGESFETLGTHLRGQFEKVSDETASERAALERSMKALLNALEDGFGAAKSAVKDPTLREDLTTVAATVREALLTTVGSAGEQVRERLGKTTTQPAAVKGKAAPKKTSGKHIG